MITLMEYSRHTDLSNLKFLGYGIKIRDGKEYQLICFDTIESAEDNLNLLNNYKKDLNMANINEDEYDESIDSLYDYASDFYEDLTYTSFEPSPTNNNIDYFIDMLKDGYYCVINKNAFSI